MRFNVRTKTTSRIINHAGAEAFSTSPEMELYTAVVTSTLSDSFYEKADKRLERIIRLIRVCDPKFVARLAVYTREQMYLRSIPLVLVTELSRVHNGDSLVSKTAARVISRADEITELLACYQLSNARTGDKKLNRISKQLQKGVAQAFNKFDEYQFAKYNRKTAVTLKDALFLTHPKAVSDSQQVLFDKIASDTLQKPYTWETELSDLGRNRFASEKAKKAAIKEKWEALISSGRLGYMAMLRNLRNILQAEVRSEAIRIVIDRLSDETEVKQARQFPFRYLAAYNELEGMSANYVSAVVKALEKAIRVSAANIAGFDMDTRVLVAADVSGSMYTKISARSKIRCYDIGLLLSTLMASRSENVVTGIFGDRWKKTSMSGHKILGGVKALNRLEGSVGYSTNAHKVIDALVSSQMVMDKVMIFTDLQLWDSHHGGDTLKMSWRRYKTTIAPHARLYLFDLTGYGQTPLKLKDNEVYLIAGWSDRIFDILSAIENGSSAMEEIRKIEL